MNILAEMGISADQAIAAAVTFLVTAGGTAIKNAIMNPHVVKQIEKENVMRDAKIEKLFAKTDALERDVLILKHESDSK